MDDKIAVIGAGMMGGAIVQSLLKSGYTGNITAVDIQPEKLEEQKKLGAAVSSDSKKAAAEADIIFICVKPNSVKDVLTQISSSVNVFDLAYTRYVRRIEIMIITIVVISEKRISQNSSLVTIPSMLYFNR